jgi:hypothetical protein
MTINWPIATPMGRLFTLSLIGEAFNIFNETNIRGTSNNNYAGRNVSISPSQPSQNGQPAQAVQSNFYSAVTTGAGSSVLLAPEPFSSPHGCPFDLT